MEENIKRLASLDAIMGETSEAVNAELSRERTDRPSRAALVVFYQALARIAQERFAAGLSIGGE